MRRCGKRAQSALGTTRCRSRSIFTGSSFRRQAEALREPAHVRVDDDSLRVAELGRDDVRGLARNSGQPHELIEPPRNLAVEVLDEHAHRSADRLRLLAKEPGRVDVSLELLDGDGEVVLRLPVLLEERRRHLVDVHVGRLRGEHHRDDELEVRAEAERDRGVHVLGREPVDDRADSFAAAAEPAPCLAHVATRHEATRSTRSSRRSRAARGGTRGAWRRPEHP